MWLAVLAIALVLGAGGYGLYKAIAGSPDLVRNAKFLPTPDPAGVFPWAEGVLCVEGAQLYCMDLKSKEPLWQTALPMKNMKAARVGKLAVAWGGNQVLLINEYGEVKQSLLAQGDVLLAAPGTSTYAVVTSEEKEKQHRLRFYSVKDEKLVDEVFFAFESVLDMGYFGDKLSQLWMLVVDSNSTQPVTKLKIYYPGKKTTGEIKLSNELAYAAFFGDNTYIVSTHTLTCWEHTGKKSEDKSKLIYGWSLEDAYVDSSGRVSFLFAPAGAGGLDSISALWYVSTAGAEYRIPLPAGCFKAMLKANGRICVATRNGVYSMAQNGSGSRFHPFGNEIASIPAVVPGQAFVIQERHRNYLINMP